MILVIPKNNHPAQVQLMVLVNLVCLIGLVGNWWRCWFGVFICGFGGQPWFLVVFEGVDAAGVGHKTPVTALV